MAREQILVIEDDSDIQELLSFNLNKEGYSVLRADTGEDGLKSARSKLPDLILLDLMLPGVDGLEVCRTLRADDKTRHIPVIMLTAKGEEVDIVTGLEVGAVDYIVKPFSPKVLIARIRNALRRKARDEADHEEITELGELVIDLGRYEVKAGGRPVDLTPTELSLLRFLLENAGGLEEAAHAVGGLCALV